MGLHFVISKLYANSFFATLNTRKFVAHKRNGSNGSGDRNLPVDVYSGDVRKKSSFANVTKMSDYSPSPKVQIQVDKTKMTISENMSSHKKSLSSTSTSTSGDMIV